MTEVAIIIPSRMGSSRFPGKPLAPICGIPMVGHCYHRALLSESTTDIFVATCDDVIKQYVRSIGGNALMTSHSHNRATTRTAEALQIAESQSNKLYDVVLMLQGDEPLVSPYIFDPILALFENPNVKIVNLISPFASLEAFSDKNNVKVVKDDFDRALYFSREPIPSPWKGFDTTTSFNQTGIIAFRRNILFEFNSLDETSLEVMESVDMNRVLQTRLCDINLYISPSPTLGVDTPSDLVAAESLMSRDPFFHLYSS